MLKCASTRRMYLCCLFGIAGFIFFEASVAMAGAEWVFVAKVLSEDDKGIIVRGNGNAYLIEKGIGCLSFWRYEGKRVLIVSPGIFLGVGSKLVLPDAGQECRIWNSKELGQWSTSVPKITQQRKRGSTLSKEDIFFCQIALGVLNYYTGEPDGLFGEKTKMAMLRFQKEKKLSQTGDVDANTALALSKSINEKFPNKPETLQLAIALLNIGKRNLGQGYQSSGCEDGHWISSVSNGGEIIVLEDGSVWQVDSIDTIDTMLWLPTENVIVCDEITMINTDNGEKVGVTRLK